MQALDAKLLRTSNIILYIAAGYTWNLCIERINQTEHTFAIVHNSIRYGFQSWGIELTNLNSKLL